MTNKILDVNKWAFDHSDKKGSNSFFYIYDGDGYKGYMTIPNLSSIEKKELSIDIECMTYDQNMVLTDKLLAFVKQFKSSIMGGGVFKRYVKEAMGKKYTIENIEPNCVCKNYSLSHEDNCAWMLWKQGER